ncbi:hypothetical protein [Absidia glauca]|uniref:PiggyBac transposable element-derived protein domain-containing protein n=1 Tax=Absidia glauca TaxID=4829 RepID=A0A168NIM4_ABSGL|nr:hypothetical protein [Absidia glauca]
MPRANPNIIVDSLVSARMHYLRRTAFASAVLSVDTNAPGTSFEGTCLRYRGRTPSRRRQTQPQQPPNVEEELDLLEDAIQPFSSAESDDEVIDRNWEECNVTVDHRMAQPDSNYQFNEVIRAINTYAQRMDSAWIDLDWAEYLTWIMLLIIITIVNCQDKKMYWRKSNSPYHINVGFTEFMTIQRFNDISQLHVFVVPDGEILQQTRGYNYSTWTINVCGRVDESVARRRNAQLEEGAPQAQFDMSLRPLLTMLLALSCAWISVATLFYASLVQMKIDLLWQRSSDSRNLGITLVELSWRIPGLAPLKWRGSCWPSDFILSCKFVKDFWPKGMPAADIVQALEPGNGSKVFMRSTVPGEYLFVGAFRDLKVKALVSTCGTTTDGNVRRFWDPNGQAWVEVVRSVDTSNNRRDNMIIFHDVMRTYRWELRCLSFFLGVAEANAFSAFKYFRVVVIRLSMANLGGGVVSRYNERLTESMKKHIMELREGPEMEQRTTRSRLGRPNGHRLVTMGKNGQGDYIRRQCKECGAKTQTRFSCNEVTLCKSCFGCHVATITRSN